LIAIIRLVVFGFIALSVVYILVSIYSRSVRREKLEKAWDTDPEREGASSDDRDAYIKAGMEAYQRGLRRRLIWLVYIIPAVVVMTTVYLVNYQ
jgi:Ca2+/Na+ antiporter